jgi:hypothetical protein
VLNYYFDEANTQMRGVVWFGPDVDCIVDCIQCVFEEAGNNSRLYLENSRPFKKKEGCKLHVEAMLDDGGEKYPVVYDDILEGLSIDHVKLSDHEDKVAKRMWEVDVCKKSG